MESVTKSPADAPAAMTNFNEELPDFLSSVSRDWVKSPSIEAGYGVSHKVPGRCADGYDKLQ